MTDADNPTPDQGTIVNAQLLAKLRREYVRQAIRDGKTFAQIMREYGGVTKRMIEDERKALAALDGSVPDARSNGVRQGSDRRTPLKSLLSRAPTCSTPPWPKSLRKSMRCVRTGRRSTGCAALWR